MKKIKIIFIILTLQSCNLLHHQDSFEMERLSEDVLNAKGNDGISIEIMKIPPKSK